MYGKEASCRAGEMVHQLITVASALSKESSSICSIHMGAYNHL